MMISKTALLLMYNVHKDRSIILRPDSLFCRTIDTSTNTVSTIRYIDIKCNQLPVDLIKKMVDQTLTKICWDIENTSAITEALLAEAGATENHIDFIDLQQWLRNNGYPYQSLNSAAKRFNIRNCCRSDIKDIKKLRTRFICLSKIAQKLIAMDNQNLIDGILI